MTHIAGSTDGFAAVTFHTKCDGRQQTLNIVKHTNGNVFGLQQWFLVISLCSNHLIISTLFVSLRLRFQI
jgi:hypothetical protein